MDLNYPAMIQALMIRIVERIPEIRLQVKRLREDIIFKLDCGFFVSDAVPSEASLSRLISKIHGSNVLEDMNIVMIHDAMNEGFISETNIAIDAGHF